MFCSTVIPTIGRPTLARAVNSVLAQTVADDIFEVIVVNDSGQPLPAATWQQDARVKVVDTNRRERSVARNTGAALAQGAYLHFLDDDDWLLPGALARLRQLACAQPNAAWLYGAAQAVDRAEKPLVQLRYTWQGNCFIQVMAGEWIPLMASLIQTEAFFAVGGFNPLIANAEDIDLLRRIALRGELAGVPDLVTCIGLGAAQSTTDQSNHAASSRWAREKVLDEPHVFARMRASADASAWQGRLARIYLTSMLWNLQHKNLGRAASRLAFGLAGLAQAGTALVSPSFWQALLSRYESDAFRLGFAALQGRGA